MIEWCGERGVRVLDNFSENAQIYRDGKDEINSSQSRQGQVIGSVATESIQQRILIYLSAITQLVKKVANFSLPTEQEELEQNHCRKNSNILYSIAFQYLCKLIFVKFY